MHNLEQASGGIGLYVNANKTDFMPSHPYFKWLAFKIRRPVHIPWQQYLIYWKGCHGCIYLFDKIKRDFFQAVSVSILLYKCTTWMLTKCMEKKLDGKYTRMLYAIFNKSWKQHSTKQQLYSHLSSHKSFK